MHQFPSDPTLRRPGADRGAKSESCLPFGRRGMLGGACARQPD